MFPPGMVGLQLFPFMIHELSKITCADAGGPPGAPRQEPPRYAPHQLFPFVQLEFPPAPVQVQN